MSNFDFVEHETWITRIYVAACKVCGEDESFISEGEAAIWCDEHKDEHKGV